MIRGKTCAYFGWTQVIGVAWYGLFLALAPKLVTGPEYLLANYTAFVPLGTFLVVSAVIGLAFRRWITRANRLRAVLLGCVLPYFGGALYAMIWGGSLRILQATGASGKTSDDLHWTELAMTGALMAFVFFNGTIPMGISSVFTLRWVDREIARRESETPANPG